MLHPHNAQERSQFVLQTLENLGWTLNADKCDLMLSTQTQFMGFDIFSTGAEGPWLKVPRAKIIKLQKCLQQVLKGSSVTGRHLARVAGRCVSMMRAVVPAKLLLRNVYRSLASKSSWEDNLLLTPAVWKDLKWWATALPSWNGAPLLKPPIDDQIYTDASGTGWGGWSQHLKASGTWDISVAYQPSNYCELLAVWRTLESFPNKFYKNKTIQVISDNATMITCINRLSSKSEVMTLLMTQFFLWLDTNNTKLVARHLSGVKNVHANWLSRVLFRHEWQIQPRVFRFIDKLFGPHDIDRFASEHTALLPRYNSMFLDRHTEAVDAFSQDWGRNINNWINPPFALLPRVIHKIKQDSACTTILAPFWKGTSWFQDLWDILVCPPMQLPTQNLFTRCAGIPEPCKNSRWRLFVWKVCGLKS